MGRHLVALDRALVHYDRRRRTLMCDLYNVGLSDTYIARLYAIPEHELWAELDAVRLSGRVSRPFYGLACRGPFG